MRIKEFDVGKRGRLLWVRWWDFPQAAGRGRTHSPSVKVRLEYLPDGFEVADLRKVIPNEVVHSDFQEAGGRVAEMAQIDAGYIPALRFGDIYLNGEKVGQIPLKRRRFTFGKTQRSAKIRSLGLPSPAPKPSWFNLPWLTLSRTVYPVTGPSQTSIFEDGQMLYLRDEANEKTLLIPCPEVFRSFYCSSSNVASALLQGPWPITRHQVVNLDPDRTGVRGDVSNIGLRRSTYDNEAPILHLLTLDEVGVKAANQIWSAPLSSSGARAAGSSQADHKPITVYLPFDPVGDFKVTAYGFNPYPTLKDHFVALRIGNWSWPSTISEIKIWRDNAGDEGEEVILSDQIQPFRHRQSALPTHRLETAPEEDARASYFSAHMRNESASIIDGPEVVHIERPSSIKRTDEKARLVEEPSSSISFAEPLSGGEAAPMDVKQISREEGVARFEAVYDMISSLCDKGVIKTFRVVPAQGRQADAVGRFQVWRFLEPRYLGHQRRTWHLLDAKARHDDLDVHRSALVLEVCFSRGVVFVGVIELRDAIEADRTPEHYCSATVVLTDPIDDAAVAELLNLCASNLGVWPRDHDDAWRLNGIEGGVKWIHRTIGSDAGALSPNAFLKSLVKLGFEL